MVCLAASQQILLYHKHSTAAAMPSLTSWNKHVGHEGLMTPSMKLWNAGAPSPRTRWCFSWWREGDGRAGVEPWLAPRRRGRGYNRGYKPTKHLMILTMRWSLLIYLVDNPVHYYGKSNKQFKSKSNIVSRIWGIRYILANCDYVFVNTEML
jgi:hypothetical protein